MAHTQAAGSDLLLCGTAAVLVGHSHDSLHVLLKWQRECGGATGSMPWGTPSIHNVERQAATGTRGGGW